MSTTGQIDLSIKDLMQLIAGKEIYKEDDRSGINIQVEDSQELSDFKEFVLALDYVIDNEYTSFQENCDCDIDISIDNWQDCKCESNIGCAFLNAMKSYEIYFNNNN